MTTLTITTASASYPIIIRDGALRALDTLIAPYANGNKLFIVTDEQVARHYLDASCDALAPLGKEVHRFILPAGEQAKSFTQFEQLCNDMLAAGPDRKTLLVALGGGVVGDLTGFVASVLLRGVPFVQIPTTLLAQVDSSVGGKTAINSTAGKNLIGSFYQPACVVMDTATLTTLPQREVLAGYAEIIKYGLLGDATFYAQLLEEAERAILGDDSAAREQIIAHCCRMKAAIVNADEKERGMRALLNLGHTFGHAIEKAAGYDGRVLHGEAVALGCLMAMSLSVAHGEIDAASLKTLKQHYAQMGLPLSISALVPDHSWQADTLTGYCYQDKKASDGALTFIRLRAIGDAYIDTHISPAHITPIFEEYL